jgi:pyridinium-3,5-biscarboxylic acid mononucleotide sulfurtransferase
MIRPTATGLSVSDKEAAVLRFLADQSEVLVAFSAGVDSTYLLDLAHQACGDAATAVTADSPSLARASLVEAQAFCTERRIQHRVVRTDEFEQADYLANDGRRCYHCKAALMRAMNALASATARERGRTVLAIGAIADDFSDVRPGMQAAAEAGACWPLAEHGFTKGEVRERSRERGLATWNRPAEPCLSSRIPYGEPVSVAAVRMIEAAELALKRAGLQECRARHHAIGGGKAFLCRIEIPIADLERAVARRQDLVRDITAIGYANVALDLAGLASGAFNRLLTAGGRTSP